MEKSFFNFCFSRRFPSQFSKWYCLVSTTLKSRPDRTSWWQQRAITVFSILLFNIYCFFRCLSSEEILQLEKGKWQDFCPQRTALSMLWYANYLAKKNLLYIWKYSFSRIATTQKNLHKVSALLEHTPLKIAHTTLEYRVITYA